MKRSEAIEHVSVVLDDALNHQPVSAITDTARLIGWQCGLEPMFVAVQSYLPLTTLSDEEAIEIATEYLAEKRWFANEPTPPDYVL